jgi:hypothetical protein
MPNRKSSGPQQPLSDEDRKNWRPADDEKHSEPTERSGQGQSGYGAGRHSEDPSQPDQNRNESDESDESDRDERPVDQGMGLDDRFTGRDRLA